MSKAEHKLHVSVPEAVTFVDLEPPASDFRADVIAGLGTSPRKISPKYLYDAQGSELFDRICQTPEYYITRTELALLEEICGEVAALTPSGAAVIEYGAGSLVKIRTLLDALRSPSRFMAIDISRDHLLAATEGIAADHPDLDLIAVCADFTQTFELPTNRLGGAYRLGFLPGSTIGNFDPADQLAILSRIARQLGGGAGLLIGADLIKNKQVLEAAYDDREGITAQFSLNLLARMRRELDAEVDLDAFKHVAVLDEKLQAIRIWIEARRQTQIKIGDAVFEFAEGERINTELAQKYTISGFHALAREAGFEPKRHWTDVEDRLSLHYLIVE